MMPRSAIYVGHVVHNRLRPRKHRLSYSCYWLLLDLDVLPSLAQRLRIFSLERFNLFSLKKADYGAGTNVSLRAQAEQHLREAGIETEGGKIFLLTMPRILGYGFNPLSLYYCYRSNGSLVALIYEVHNTFGQRHSYLVAVGPDGERLAHSCEKRFYVSPFLDMDLSYDFEVTEPADQASVAIRASDNSSLLLTAFLSATREELTDWALIKNFIVHPLLTFKVIAAIHWEALRLWLKGVGLVPRPAPPDHPVTSVSSRGSHE